MRSLTKAGVAVAASLVTITTALAPAAQADTPPPAVAAAGWLTGQFTGGTHLVTESQGSKYDDPGLTADAILALTAAQTGDAQATAATTWLAKNVASYVGPGAGKPSATGDKAGAAYAGALAKTALVAQVRGESAAAFGGRDLITELKAREGATGRFSDDSTYGDYSNAITQSLALIVLKRSGTEPSAAAVKALESLQCTDGGFRNDFPVAGKTSPCVSDVDATGWAIQGLMTVSTDSVASKAGTYLVASQKPDGGWANASVGGAPAVENANTTGLAVAALVRTGHDAQAANGISYLTGLQQKAGTAIGAVNFTSGAFVPATAARATTGALLGFTHTDFGSLAAASSTTGSGGSVGASASASGSSTASSAASVAQSQVSSVQPAVSSAQSQSSSVAGSSGAGSSASSVPSNGHSSTTASGSSGMPGWVLALIIVAAVVVLGGGGLLLARRRSSGH